MMPSFFSHKVAKSSRSSRITSTSNHGGVWVIHCFQVTYVRCPLGWKPQLMQSGLYLTNLENNDLKTLTFLCTKLSRLSLLADSCSYYYNLNWQYSRDNLIYNLGIRNKLPCCRSIISPLKLIFQTSTEQVHQPKTFPRCWICTHAIPTRTNTHYSDLTIGTVSLLPQLVQ